MPKLPLKTEVLLIYHEATIGRMTRPIIIIIGVEPRSYSSSPLSHSLEDFAKVRQAE